MTTLTVTNLKKVFISSKNIGPSYRAVFLTSNSKHVFANICLLFLSIIAISYIIIKKAALCLAAVPTLRKCCGVAVFSCSGVIHPVVGARTMYPVFTFLMMIPPLRLYAFMNERKRGAVFAVVAGKNVQKSNVP